MPAAGRRFIASWSGGKDSCLALYRTLQAGGQPLALFNMFDENGERSRSHGVRPEVMRAQAAALGLPLFTANASWQNYEEVFVESLKRFRADGAELAVFGDIDLDAHREWEEKVCARAGLEACLPLWQEPRADLVNEFVAAGFKAVIVVVNEQLMPSDGYLGATLDAALIEKMVADGIDPCGEAGEFHTLVVDGPLFGQPLPLVEIARHRHDGYAMLEFGLATPT